MAEIAGPLRIAGPLSFGTLHLAPALADFAAAHPRVELDVAFDDRTIDLVGGGFDLAVRLGNLADSTLIARKLAPLRRALVASPSFLAAHGVPQHPRDLAGWPALTYANSGAPEAWRFRVGDRWESVRLASRLRADNGDMLRAAAVAGLGLTVLPTFIASPALASGALEIVLPGFPLEEGGVYAVLPAGRTATARVRALIDFLAARFGPEPNWDPCWLAERSAQLGDGQPVRLRAVAD